jgi:hypothetical protein
MILFGAPAPKPKLPFEEPEQHELLDVLLRRPTVVKKRQQTITKNPFEEESEPQSRKPLFL